MPLYETVMQEKPPIVLDIGTAYTKLGFAGEAYPRKIIPSKITLSANGKIKDLFDYTRTQELHDYIVDFLQMIFFKHLLVSPKERKVVVVEDVFGQTVVREVLAGALFRHFEVSSVLFAPSHMIAVSSLAVPTAMVVDIGYSETTVMPVYSGVQILKAFKDQSYGGRAIHAEIKRQLVEAGIRGELLTESILEDIKVRTCFVTSLDRAQSYRDGKIPERQVPSIEYPIVDDEIINIDGRLRETVFEIMFEDNNERDNLPHLILQSVLQCSIDFRKTLLENIFIIGGSAIIMGLLPRLKAELEHLLSTDKDYMEKFHGDIKLKFHKTIGRQNFAAWLGGSLCGATDLIQSRSTTREAYMKNGRVPDWVCLADNRTGG